MSLTDIEKLASQTPAKPEAMVQLTGVGVRYQLLTDDSRTLKGRVLSALSARARDPEFWALRDVNLKLEAGQVLGIIGSNGSGKSTLLRVIAGILTPAEGAVVTRGRVTPILDLIGTLNPEFSGRDNAFLFGALHGLSRAQVQEWTPWIVEFTELGPFFEVPLKAYSSGMVARLAFALATKLNPDILLLDEVLAVGDEQFQRKSYFRVRKLIEKGNLVVIVSHNVAMLEQTCNRMILIGGGRVLADGAPSGVVSEYRRQAERRG